jgi:adenosine deaminase
LDVLKVERIDHGVQATNDAALVTRLVRDKIALTVCPLSNLKLRVFPGLAQHNLGQMLKSGLLATVNSDDPAYFGGYINENFTQTFSPLGLNAAHAYQLANNSFEASFIDAAAKRVLQDRLTEFFETFD